MGFHFMAFSGSSMLYWAASVEAYCGMSRRFGWPNSSASAAAPISSARSAPAWRSVVCAGSSPANAATSANLRYARDAVDIALIAGVVDGGPHAHSADLLHAALGAQVVNSHAKDHAADKAKACCSMRRFISPL